MRCQSCGWNFYFKTQCPRCGKNGLEPRNAFAKFLAAPVSIGNFVFNVLYLYFFIAVNVSIVSLVVNLVVYNTQDGAGGVWAHYVILGLFAFFILFRSFFLYRTAILSSIRHLAYLVLAFFAVTQAVMWDSGNYVHVSYIIPILYVCLSLFAFIALAKRWTTPFSFYLTLAASALISIAPFIIALKCDLPFSGQVINYVAFGIAMISFVNAFFLKMLSMLFRARGGTRTI